MILIIGILAAIALPAFLGQRAKGQDSSARSPICANARLAGRVVPGTDTLPDRADTVTNPQMTQANTGPEPRRAARRLVRARSRRGPSRRARLRDQRDVEVRRAAVTHLRSGAAGPAGASFARSPGGAAAGSCVGGHGQPAGSARLRHRSAGPDPAAWPWRIRRWRRPGGLLAGSFLNVVAWRLPRGESLVLPARTAPAASTRCVRATTCPWCRGWCCAAAAATATRRSPPATRSSRRDGRAGRRRRADDDGLHDSCSGSCWSRLLVPIALIDLDHRIIPNSSRAGALAALAIGLATDSAGVPSS